MQQSEQLNELIAALSKAQGQFRAVPKSGKNPHLKNKYATLDDIIEAIRGPLADNSLAYMQWLSNEDGLPTLVTMLAHESGQWISSSAVIDTMPANRGVNDMQAFGASLTYMKRYALAAMLGISSDEDVDGTGATSKPAQRKPSKKSEPKKKSGPPEDLKDIQETDFLTTYEEVVDDGFDMRGYIHYVGSLLIGAGYTDERVRKSLVKDLLGTTDLTEPTVGCWRLMEQYARFLSNSEDKEKDERFGKQVVKKGVEEQVDWFGAIELIKEEVEEIPL